jgi:hypothetical protein
VHRLPRHAERRQSLGADGIEHRHCGCVAAHGGPAPLHAATPWNDIAKFKGPVLRALAARPPYFHDGSAATLADVIKFYDERFQARFTEQEKRDLIAFLLAL